METDVRIMQAAGSEAFLDHGYLAGLLPSDTPGAATTAVDDPAAGLTAFRREFYRCLTRRADALFELVDAALFADGPVG